jgi:3-(methylthio)propanoyl-CoA dehydrogenase
MARFSVGIQGLGIAERAYQQALGYARERRQGGVAIIRHPDVRRMLLTMKSTIEAMRALACVVAEAADHARVNPDAAARQRAHGFMSLLTPVVKGWSTESAVTLTSLGVQVHGGMGFIEETGAAQYLRDARITPIYEGTTGIQANDLVGRKILRDGGQAAFELIATMSRVKVELSRSHNAHLGALARSLERGIQSLDQAVRCVVERGREHLSIAQAGAEPLLHLLGIVAGGWQLGRGALAAERHLQQRQGDLQFHESRIMTARFYGDSVLSRASGLAHAVVHGADSILGLTDEQL